MAKRGRKKKTQTLDFGDDLPKIIQVVYLSDEFFLVKDSYVFEEKGKYFKDGKEIICLKLLQRSS